MKSNLGQNLIRWYGNRGGVRLSLGFKQLQQIDFPRITLEQQNNILAKIKALQPKIDNLLFENKNQKKIIKELRQAILYEAISGKLVPQDPKNKSASDLLDDIQLRKKRLIKKTKTKKDRKTIVLSKSEIPFKLPNNWIWVRLSEIALVTMGQSPKGHTYNTLGNGTPLINGPVEFSKGSFGLTKMTKWTTSPTKKCKKGDILLCVRGSTTGRTNVAGSEACIGRGVASIVPLINKKYFHYFLIYSKEMIFNKGSGTTFPNITLNEINNLVFPLPPLLEQERIVKKVDCLIGYCDKLKQIIKEKKENIELLNESILRESF